TVRSVHTERKQRGGVWTVRTVCTAPRPFHPTRYRPMSQTSDRPFRLEGRHQGFLVHLKGGEKIEVKPTQLGSYLAFCRAAALGGIVFNWQPAEKPGHEGRKAWLKMIAEAIAEARKGPPRPGSFPDPGPGSPVLYPMPEV